MSQEHSAIVGAINPPKAGGQAIAVYCSCRREAMAYPNDKRTRIARVVVTKPCVAVRLALHRLGWC